MESRQTAETCKWTRKPAVGFFDYETECGKRVCVYDGIIKVFPEKCFGCGRLVEGDA